jgi:hypothetical protein
LIRLILLDTVLDSIGKPAGSNMVGEQDATTDEDGPNQQFYDKAIRALRELFEKAKAAHELHFAMAMMPEFRGSQDAGWSTAEEAVHAYDQFTGLIKSMSKDDIVRLRVILAFYLQVAEGSGFYEIPKKMMLTIGGRGNNLFPFASLVKRHEKTGRAIDPNANLIMRDLMGHAYELGLTELSEVFDEAFDSDVRNAVAHADYIIAQDGLRIRRKNGGAPRVIPWEEFDALISRGINLFSIIRQIVEEYVKSYDPPKTVKARLANHEPIFAYTIYYDPEKGAFGWTTGKSPLEGYSQGVAQT